MSSVLTWGLRRQWGSQPAAMVRLLISADVPLTQVAISRAVGAIQPRAKQVLDRLDELAAIRRSKEGYTGRPNRLLDLYRERAGLQLVEPERCWSGRGTPAEQVRRIIDRAAEGETPIAFSADYAASLLEAPIEPTLTVAYTTEAFTLEDAEFVPVDSRDDASIIVRRTGDAALLSPAPRWPHNERGVPLTDPVVMWCDLLDLGGEERKDAAKAFRTAIVEREIPGAL